MRSPFEWSAYTWFWVAWLAVSVTSFAVVETLAILDPREHDTLTENVVAYAKTHPIRGAAIVVFLTWLLIHFVRRIG